MSDPSGRSFDSGATGGTYNPATHDWHEHQRGEMFRQQDQKNQAAKTVNYGPSGNLANQPSGGGGGLLWFALILAGFAVSIVAGVLAVIGGAVAMLMARSSSRGRLTYREGYAASFYTTTGYALSILLVLGAIYFYRAIPNPYNDNGAFYYIPLHWRFAAILITLQPLGVLAGGYGLKKRLPERYAGYDGYLRACVSGTTLLIFTLLLAAIISIPIILIVEALNGGIR